MTIQHAPTGRHDGRWDIDRSAELGGACERRTGRPGQRGRHLCGHVRRPRRSDRPADRRDDVIDGLVGARVLPATRGGRSVRHPLRPSGHRTLGELSAGSPGYSADDLVADAAGVLEALQCPSAHVVGISMGGALAQLLALSRPELVDSLTLISTSAGAGDADLPPISPELRDTSTIPAPEPDFADRRRRRRLHRRVLPAVCRPIGAVRRRGDPGGRRPGCRPHQQHRLQPDQSRSGGGRRILASPVGRDHRADGGHPRR